MRRGSYGIDAPYLLPIPILLIGVNVANGILSATVWPFVAAGLILVCLGLGAYASRRGKFIVWSRITDALGLRGDERVLDIGCGRGAVLLVVAEHLTSGRAIGVDLWRRGDQSGNAADRTRANAAAEGVAERVGLSTADMLALPFAADSFDVVVSNVAMHNVKGSARRGEAVGQAVRVLRPGGRLLIADLFGARQYEAELIRLGMHDVRRRSLGWRMWWSGPWLATHLVTATKPAQG